MTFTSYAQNLEDVLLFRALGNINQGSYIDVGAGDPEYNSVTKAFYDLGWSGINIEPEPGFFSRLNKDRERDVNLDVALSDKEGEITFYAVGGHEELLTVMPVLADEYQAQGRPVEEITLMARTLQDVVSEFVDGPVHFLKVDVEGAEGKVLQGADFTTFRPWIVVVESVAFGRDTLDWEDILLAANYGYVYFDGLNRFYVATEHNDLVSHFAVPVNVTDRYRRPTSLRTEIVLQRIAEVLGLHSYSDEHEVLERVQALRADRIEFELLAEASRGLALSREGQLEQVSAALEAVQGELEGYWQQSFERERYIAWQAAEVVHVHGLIRTAEDQSRSLRASASWRCTLPLRVARHPRLYLRILRGRFRKLRGR